jgi:hypothetical protein
LPEEEIGCLNFLEFDALRKRRNLNDDKLRLNAGFIYAAIHNTAPGDPNRDAVQPTDIVPSMRRDAKDVSQMTAAEAKAHIFRVFQGAGKRNS